MGKSSGRWPGTTVTRHDLPRRNGMTLPPMALTANSTLPLHPGNTRPDVRQTRTNDLIDERQQAPADLALVVAVVRVARGQHGFFAVYTYHLSKVEHGEHRHISP